MTRFTTVVFQWDGQAMRPTPRFRNIAVRQFKEGESYALEVSEERSSKSEAHYFAALNEAWQNLDEDALQKLKTPKHLRSWALIEAGWYDEMQIDCGSQERAMQMAAWSRSGDDYAEIRVRGSNLVIRRAKSQSRRSMDKQQFEESKRAVLEILSGAIHVPRRVLEREARLRTP